MEIVDVVLDFVAIFLAIGIFFYGSWLARLFRGGLMDKGFRLLVYSPLAFAVSEFLHIIYELRLGPAYFATVHSVLELVFLAGLFGAVILLYRAWRSIGH